MVDPPVPFAAGRKVPETAARGASRPDDVAGGRQAIGGLKGISSSSFALSISARWLVRGGRFAAARFAVEAGRRER
jgi:hypothetical protein